MKEQLKEIMTKNDIAYTYKVNMISKYLNHPEIKWQYMNKMIDLFNLMPNIGTHKLKAYFMKAIRGLLPQTEIITNQVSFSNIANHLFQVLYVGQTILNYTKRGLRFPEPEKENTQEIEAIKAAEKIKGKVKTKVAAVQEELSEEERERIRKNHERARKMREAKARKRAERELLAKLEQGNS